MLYIAARDIGNYKDNTERLKEILIKSDIILAESFREATTLFKILNINIEREKLIEFSEHTNKSKEIYEIVEKILNCKIATLISDCGTPILEDPGKILLEYCYSNNVKVKPIPGVSSITAAIMCLPFNFKEFYYAGLLSRDDKERERKLIYLKKLNIPIIILDTPYRMNKVLNAIKKVYSKNKIIGLCLDLTTDKEEIIIDEIVNICERFNKSEDKNKREFVIVIS
ncbi:tetrapyrrole methylase [Brachyspira aalborgi]|jgi:16S rRNA (cytidine1402-2'-O)-methyltransferase|uniref:Tetrapyrrole methylase n=1 Tax=Brachyspira aalborgi TaxID=29522 RepID=A0AB38Q063_9SPIR|nr:SAM-dependent methyltransferase [Brachyspira aalborgi]MBS4762852.1 tetrapyrrole methylase [Brachyspira sp.]CCY76221.1 tetrapyrrole (Corrin/porphyrin) methylase [Brachyspira sp. CAG:700]TXJ14441.1 tetrapyrrole methylase [Brachyspira aalborgi]TXJ19219.1 tetrapyrrole methylase [Brachyspira aalborgi]TXJ25345.1 tetrapyrrole methylase [Brachyspira aalborgi]